MKGVGGASASDKPRVQHTSIVPVTLKQIQMAPQDPNEDKLLIDGREVTQVRVVGQIQEMTVSATNTNYTFQLDDGTAYTEVKVWIHEDPNGGVDYHQYTKANWRQGIYVEVFGTIKVLSTKENKRSIMAQRVNVITDFNLVTHHFLECIHAHLFALKGGNLGNHLQQVVGGIQKFDPYSASRPGSIKAEPAPTPYNNSMDTNSASGGLHADLINVCKQAPPKGFPVSEIAIRLPKYTLAQIQQAIAELLPIGDIFTALDNQYRA